MYARRSNASTTIYAKKYTVDHYFRFLFHRHCCLAQIRIRLQERCSLIYDPHGIRYGVDLLPETAPHKMY